MRRLGVVFLSQNTLPQQLAGENEHECFVLPVVFDQTFEAQRCARTYAYEPAGEDHPSHDRAGQV
jgi:hypothetical protein